MKKYYCNKLNFFGTSVNPYKGCLPDDEVQRLEELYKGSADPEGSKFYIWDKFQLECSRRLAWEKGNMVLDTVWC